MSARWANALTAVGVVGLVALLALTAPSWARRFQQTIPSQEEDRSAGGTPVGPAEIPEASRKISVKLFFEAPDQPALVIEERTVELSQDLASQIRSVVEELIRGSEQNLVAPLDQSTKVLSVFVSGRGIAYVDLSKEATRGGGGGSQGELLTVYAIVNSIAANFPAVRRVQLLIDDRPSETLAGHVDLSRPLPPDMTFLGATALNPVKDRAS